ncbi:MAG: hypothetical protein U0411_11275 [Thermodesulfovibrionales bacterium]
MRRFLVRAGFVLLFLGGIAYFVVMFTGPHMATQPHLLPYEQPMPPPPPGVVPVEPDLKAPPPEAQAAGLRNPLPDTPENRARGRVYYGYYCVFCHGESGRGDGPVGNSYMPRPADLGDPGLLDKSDGELLRSLLLGIGHEPVLRYVVPPEHRWYLVLQVRAFGRTTTP